MRLTPSTTPQERAPVPEPLAGWRVVANPSSIDEIGGVVLRFAPDDALALSDTAPEISDPDAIVERDTGWVSLRLSEKEALELISIHATWHAPVERPSFAQGMLAGLPAKVYLNGAASLIVVPAPFAHELDERLRP
jgi:hypothetical protein